MRRVTLLAEYDRQQRHEVVDDRRVAAERVQTPHDGLHQLLAVLLPRRAYASRRLSALTVVHEAQDDVAVDKERHDVRLVEVVAEDVPNRQEVVHYASYAIA